MKYSTFILVGVCVIIFLLQISIQGFTDNFVLKKELLFNEPWRLLTSIFLHSGIPHLLLNMFSLALFGIILEKLIGSNKFLLVFFASGIIANLIAVNFYSSSLGASGAIYGILGCLAIIKPLMMIWAFGFPMPMFIAAILWVGAGVLGVFMPSNVGDIAHLSGIGIGFIIGLVLREWRKAKKELMRVPEGYMRIWENNYMR